MEISSLPPGKGILLADQLGSADNSENSWYNWVFSISSLLLILNAVLGSALFEIFWRKTERYR